MNSRNISVNAVKMSFLYYIYINYKNFASLTKKKGMMSDDLIRRKREGMMSGEGLKFILFRLENKTMCLRWRKLIKTLKK